MSPCLSDLKRENTKGLLFLFFFCILKLICVEKENEDFNSFITVVISYDPELDCNQFFFSCKITSEAGGDALALVITTPTSRTTLSVVE